MSPSDTMIRTIRWICACCGEMARTPRPPHDCSMCGRDASSFEEQREAALPSD